MDWNVPLSQITNASGVDEDHVKASEPKIVCTELFLKSPLYHEDRREWFMTLYPQGNNNNITLGIFLHGKDGEQMNCLEEVKFFVIQEDGQVEPRSEKMMNMSTNGHGNDIGTWQFEVRSHNFYRMDRKSRDSKPTLVKIRCVIQVKPEVHIPLTESSLSKDFARILDWKELIDFKIHCGGKTHLQ